MNLIYPWAEVIDPEEHARLTAEEKAALQSDITPADRREGEWIVLQGRPEQAWPARRCSPEMAHVVDALPEPYDQGERTGRRRMGILAAWERGLLQPSVRQAVGWFTVMAFVLAAAKFWK